MMKNLSTRIETICIWIGVCFVCVCVCIKVRSFWCFFFFILLSDGDKKRSLESLRIKRNQQCQRTEIHEEIVTSVNKIPVSVMLFMSWAWITNHRNSFLLLPSKFSIWKLFAICLIWVTWFFSLPKNGQKWQKKMKNYLKMTENWSIKQKKL